MEMTTITGTCKWFDEKKGYGFILSPEIGVDIFVHYKHIEVSPDQREKPHIYRTLVQGELVEFQPTRTDKGIMATKVVRLIEVEGKNGKEEDDG